MYLNGIPVLTTKNTDNDNKLIYCNKAYVTYKLDRYFSVLWKPGEDLITGTTLCFYWGWLNILQRLKNPLFEEIDNFTDIWALKRQGKKLEIY